MTTFLTAITGLQWFGIYAAGFVVTFILLAIFGRKFGIDYDGPKDYSNYDDYNSNAEAYVAWSVAWPMLAFFGTFIGTYMLLTLLATLILNISWTKEKLPSDSLEPVENQNGETNS